MFHLVGSIAFVLFVIELGSPAGEHEIDLEVGDDVRGGQEFEAVQVLFGDLADFQRGLGRAVSFDEAGVDEAEGFHQIGPGAAAGIEDDDGGIGEAIGQVEIFPQGGIDAADHVADDFRRGVPDAEVFAQLGIELGEEGFVEILDGIAHVVSGEEAGAVHAGEAFLGPVEDFLQVEGADLPAVGELDEEGAEDGQAEVLGGEPPLEAVAGFRVLFMPEDPGGEDAVEKRLDEGGLEEVGALFALEVDAERLAEGFFHRLQRAHGSNLDAGAGLAGITGEIRGEVLRSGDAGIAEQGAAEELPEAFVFRVIGIGAEGVRFGPEFLLAGSEVVVLAADGLAALHGPDGVGAVVGEEDLAVAFEIGANLVAGLEGGEVFVEWLDLNDAALGLEFSEKGVGLVTVLFQFLGGEESAVRNARAVVRRVDDGGDLGFQRVADGVEEIGKGGLAGGFGSAGTEGGV